MAEMFWKRRVAVLMDGHPVPLGFAVAGDSKMGTQAFQCGFGSVLECHRDGVLARCRPNLDLAGLQLESDGSGGVGDELDCRWDMLWFDPDAQHLQANTSKHL